MHQGGNEQQQNQQNKQVDNTTYSVHFHHGQWSYMPENWGLPCVGVLDTWWHWCIGDTVRNIPS